MHALALVIGCTLILGACSDAENNRQNALDPKGPPALVILDEVHHAGDARSWGDAVKEAFEPAVRRLTLTGTPFRSAGTAERNFSGVQRPLRRHRPCSPG